MCVTVVEPTWLVDLGKGCPMLRLSPPLASPPPRYDQDADEATCYVAPSYGIHNWRLPAVVMPLRRASQGDVELQVRSISQRSTRRRCQARQLPNLHSQISTFTRSHFHTGAMTNSCR